LKRKIITTSDGSTTIYLPEINEQYHSIHGAVQEALHVFINDGLHYFNNELNTKKNTKISILEIGFGTGLNALLTVVEAEKLEINYEGVEAYPVSKEELEKLNYTSLLAKKYTNIERLFNKIHKVSWEKQVSVTEHFTLKKRKQFFEKIEDENCFDIIYFDAFGARVQPELWTETIFIKMFKALKNNGILVTYSAKGSVRRALITAGFTVERLPGPPGKREMLRAKKII